MSLYIHIRIHTLAHNGSHLYMAKALDARPLFLLCLSRLYNIECVRILMNRCLRQFSLRIVLSVSKATRGCFERTSFGAVRDSSDLSALMYYNVWDCQVLCTFTLSRHCSSILSLFIPLQSACLYNSNHRRLPALLLALLFSSLSSFPNFFVFIFVFSEFLCFLFSSFLSSFLSYFLLCHSVPCLS